GSSRGSGTPAGQREGSPELGGHEVWLLPHHMGRVPKDGVGRERQSIVTLIVVPPLGHVVMVGAVNLYRHLPGIENRVEEANPPGQVAEPKLTGRQRQLR